MIRYRIFQYNAPEATDDNTRWIAADSQERADAAARRRGWSPEGGEIFIGSRHIPKDRAGLKQFGCDVIVSIRR